MEMQLAAWIGSGLVFLSFFMKTIVPLRTMAIASNVAFISYALMGLHFDVFDKVMPILVLHLALLPLNLVRLHQIKTTIRRVKSASGKHRSIEFLVPYMNLERHARGEVLFRKGDPANRVYLIHSGRVCLTEIGKTLVPGDFFGEVGVFSDNGRRTMTVACEEDCLLYSISNQKVVELFFQEPSFGFFIARALSRYA